MTSALEELPRSVRWRIQLGSLTIPNSSEPVTLESVLKCNNAKIQEQNERFQKLIDQYLTTEEEEEAEVVEEATSSQPEQQQHVANDMDPLTAMVVEQEARETRKAELYLKYRKERARRKRGLLTATTSEEDGSNDGIDRASLGIIEKDLNRLPHPTESGLGPNAPNLTPKQESRIHQLREVLYLYAQVHPDMGYRQGMHEIASYLLFVLELEQPLFPEHPLFNPILAICFDLLEKTLGKLHTAYDNGGGEDALQRMSHSILSKIHQNDPTLCQLLTQNPNIPPPPIYCTRWLRLLFSREVQGYETVFRLWDLFFSLLRDNELMHVLEVTASSRILLLRNALLHPENNPLDLLMNVPPLTNISTLSDTLKRLILQQPSSSQTVPEHVGLVPSVPMPSPQQQRMQSTESIGSSDSDKFSFGSLRQQLGQTGNTLRQKLITTTNEWKQQHNNTANQQPGTSVIVDPLLHPTSSATSESMAIGSPKQHQHEMWSQLLKKKIWTVQDYLMKIESKETGQKVPGEVWEALVDLDRMQRELCNYAKIMDGEPRN